MSLTRKNLEILLSSGRSLVYDVSAIKNEVCQKPEQLRGNFLFENEMLCSGIFFKDIKKNQDDNLIFSSRVYFPTEQDYPDLGGRSYPLDPVILKEVVGENGLLPGASIRESRDIEVLRILDEAVTFDPFFLLSMLSQKVKIEKIDEKFVDFHKHELSALHAFSKEILYPILSVAFYDVKSDIYTKGPEFIDKKIDKMIDAIINGCITTDLYDFFTCFGAKKSNQEKVLITLRGIIYYKYHYRTQNAHFQNLFNKINSSLKYNNYIGSLSSENVIRYENKLKTFSTYTIIIEKLFHKLDIAIENFSNHQNPKDLIEFIKYAPLSFAEVSVKFAILVHACSAANNLSRGENALLRKNEIEDFFDFLYVVAE